MKRLMQFALAALLTLGFATHAAAAECEDIKFADSATVDGTKLVLNGLGIREATMMQIDVYVAGLYVENKSKSPSKLLDPKTKKKLVLMFVRDVDKSDMVDAYNESFKKAAGGNFGKFKKDFKRLLSWMGDIDEGETMVYTYVPGKGLEVSLKGKTKGTIKGGDFAKTFFSIWLGKNPPNSGLKTGLLGGECG